MDMTLEISELQHQFQTLSARLTEQAAQLADQAKQIADKDIHIAKLETLVKHYEWQLLMSKRRQFGPSSEKTDSDIRQLSLFGETPAPPSEPEPEEITYKRTKRKGKREQDLVGLPIERVEHELPEDKRDCPECGEPMRDIGADVRRELKLIPAKVVVVENATHAYACPSTDCLNENGSTVIVKADSPAPLIAGSLASPSLVAHIAMQKYLNGMPLYRIEKGFQYDGVVISRQTMSNWVIKCVEVYLISIYVLLKSFLLKEPAIHGDETTHQVLREPGRAAQTKSYQWLYRTSGCSERKIVIFDYKETRSQKHPQEFLKDFKGFLHCDGYQAYHNLHSDITIVGCWFHSRSYFEKILKSIPEEKRKGTDAERGVAFINRLFDLEREFKELSPEERYKQRLEKSKPIAEAFFGWVNALGALPKTPLGQAVHYALSQRKYLENFLLDGRLELSNNRAERTIKAFVIGRKAWLFSNTPKGAVANSILYSIVETAKENNLHPYHYIKFLLEELPNATTNNLESLLPWSQTLPDWCRVPMKGESA
jgi:transposase